MRRSLLWLSLILILFWLSGAVALVYEVLWLRQIALLFGATAFTTGAALASFMAGLSIGGYLGGRIAARHRSPLWLYGCLELGLVLAVSTVGPLLSIADPLFAWLYRTGPHALSLNAARTVVCFLVLLGPTILMGATLPTLAQVVARSPQHLARRLGALYAFNTFGAAIGSFFTGFFLLAHLGVSGTRRTALIMNTIVGLSALAISRFAPGLSPGSLVPVPLQSTRPRGRAPGLFLIAYGFSGAVALACEVIWTRTLVFFTGSTTYAFTVMLVVLLLGLATGSLLMGRFADRLECRHQVLASVLIAIAAALVGSYVVLPQLAATLEAWVMPIVSWSRILGATVIMAAGTLFLPAVGFGSVFPLVARHEILRGDEAGLGTGRAYATNLIGSVVGALTGGFVLVPAFGLYGTLRLLALSLLVLALLLLARAPMEQRNRVRRVVTAVALLVVIPLWVVRQTPLYRPGPGESLLYYAEGAGATVSVLRDPTGAKTLSIDRIGVAGTDPVMQTDQKSLAHLPMLLHQEPRHVLTVGFGSGGASWSYTRYPMLESVDCVEIAPEVVAAAPYLREANHHLFDDRRYRIIIDDARAYLLHTSASYDIIATDCTDLRYRGNASLYTLDYFRLCRRRLRPNGLVVVWMPLGGLSRDVFKMAVNTFAAAFPHVSVWYMNNYPTHYLLLIGSAAPQAIQWERLLERMDLPEVRTDLESIDLADPFKLLSMFLMDDATLRRFIEGAAVNSDDWPLLEFRAPQSTDQFSGARNLQDLLDAVARRPATLPLVTRYGSVQRRTVVGMLEPYRRAALLLNRGHVSYQSGSQDFQSALAYYQRAAAVNPGDRQIPELIQATARTRDRILAVYEAAFKVQPEAPGVLHNLGLILLAAGQPKRAVEIFQRLAALRPNLAEPHLDLSRAARLAGDTATARRAAASAVRLAPERADVHFQEALVLQDVGVLNEALQAYRRALTRQPDMVEAHFNAGTVLVALGRLAEARIEYEAGLYTRPDEPWARLNLAQILLLLGERGAALKELQRAASDEGSAGTRARQLLAEVEQAAGR
jgi:spermidine synthase